MAASVCPLQALHCLEFRANFAQFAQRTPRRRETPSAAFSAGAAPFERQVAQLDGGARLDLDRSSGAHVLYKPRVLAERAAKTIRRRRTLAHSFALVRNLMRRRLAKSVGRALREEAKAAPLAANSRRVSVSISADNRLLAKSIRVRQLGKRHYKHFLAASLLGFWRRRKSRTRQVDAVRRLN